MLIKLIKKTFTFNNSDIDHIVASLVNSSTVITPFGFSMSYAMEDTQNSAPGSVTATKLGATRKGTDSQSVTKRLVYFIKL